MKFSSITYQLLTLLRVRGKSVGLEITDTALRAAWNEGGVWRTAVIRLTPGVIVEGKVIDAPQFKQALASLRAEMGAFAKKDTPLHTVMSLGSVPIYTQVFNLPMLEGERLHEAASLNLTMSSPIEAEHAYSGWQLLGHDEKSIKLDILSAYVDRAMVDGAIAIMKEEKFIPGVVEPKVLSLARLVRAHAAGFDPAATSLFIVQTETGLQLLILKNGSLYFQYFIAWSEMQAGGREITWEVFQQAFTEHMRKVVNFQVSHVNGTLTEAFLIAGDLKEGITNIVTSQFNITVHDLQLSLDTPVEPEWFAAIGAGMRGLTPLAEDKELSLLGITARGEFIRQQTLRFLSFWRVAFPVWLIVLVGIGFGVKAITARSRTGVEERMRIVSASEQGKDIQELTAKAKAFNASVQALTAAGAGGQKIPALETVQSLFDTYGVTFTRLSLTGGKNVLVEGRIATEEKLLAFAQAIREGGTFGNLSLPLQEIVVDERGVSFSMTFSIIALNTP